MAELESALLPVVTTLSSCTFALPQAPNSMTSDDFIDVYADGVQIPRDTTNMNGWNYTDAPHTSIQIYGSTCAAIVGGDDHHRHGDLPLRTARLIMRFPRFFPALLVALALGGCGGGMLGGPPPDGGAGRPGGSRWSRTGGRVGRPLAGAPAPASRQAARSSLASASAAWRHGTSSASPRAISTSSRFTALLYQGSWASPPTFSGRLQADRRREVGQDACNAAVPGTAACCHHEGGPNQRQHAPLHLSPPVGPSVTCDGISAASARGRGGR